MAPRLNEEQELTWHSWVDMVLADARARRAEDDLRLRDAYAELEDLVRKFLTEGDRVITSEADEDIQDLIDFHVNDELKFSRRRAAEDILNTRVLVDDILKNATPTTESAEDTSAKEESIDHMSVDIDSIGGEPVGEEPDNEEPANEESTNEEPANEEPTNEEPVNEEPANKEPADQSVPSTPSAPDEDSAASSSAAKKKYPPESFKVLGETIFVYDVPHNKYIVEWPSRSREYYVLDCPICKIHYHKVALLYKHIKLAHQGILTGDISYVDAITIAGTTVLSCDPDDYRNHNHEYQRRKNVSCPIHVNMTDPLCNSLIHTVGNSIYCSLKLTCDSSSMRTFGRLSKRLGIRTSSFQGFHWEIGKSA